MNRLIAEGLEDSFGVGTIGLVAGDVGAHRVWRQEDDAVAQVLELASPMVGHAAGLHHDGRRPPRGKKRTEARPRKPMSFSDVFRTQRHRNLKDGLRDINRNGRILHGGLLLPQRGLSRGSQLWHDDAGQVVGGVHFIIPADALEQTRVSLDGGFNA